MSKRKCPPLRVRDCASAEQVTVRKLVTKVTLFAEFKKNLAGREFCSVSINYFKKSQEPKIKQTSLQWAESVNSCGLEEDSLCA